MSAREDELEDASERLVLALEKVRNLELQKRSKQISSPEFHQLAHAVTEASNEVMRIARAEEGVGNQTDRRRESMDDLAADGDGTARDADETAGQPATRSAD